MNHQHSRTGMQSHSLSHHGSDDIKKGLQKIKQAQIQVLRELRKDDTQLSRNHSLTYSKETTLDSKPNFKFDGEAALSKQKIQKLHQQVSELSGKEVKLRKQCLLLTEQVKKWKDAAAKAEYKMKQYEKSEQRALAKAQQGLANAITSQKKYISIKTQYDKINKERQRLTHELKRIQKKEISEIINSHQNQSHISNKLIKQLNSAQQVFHDLVREINNHKCVKKQQGSTSKNIQPTISVNNFTISTFETQEKLDKNINNIIMYLNALQNLSPINHVNQSNNYMSGSFRDDMRKIQQQLDQDSKGKKQKIIQLQSTIQTISKKNSKLEADLRELQQQNNLLKTRLKGIAKQLEDMKLSKIILEEEYEKFKKNSGQKLKTKTQEFEEYKNKYNLSTSASAHIDKSKRSNANSSNPQSSEPLIQKMGKLEKQNKYLQEQYSQSLLQQQSLKELVQQLEQQIESMKNQSIASQTEQKHELTKLAIRMQAEKNNNRKSYQQWDAMVRSLSKMHEERMQMIRKEKEINSKLEHEQKKHQIQVETLEQQLQQLKQQVEEMRRQSIALSFDQVDLLRLRNKENANKESLIFNQTVHELWNQKQGQFNNLNTLLSDINPQAKQSIPTVKTPKAEPLPQPVQVGQLVQQLPQQVKPQPKQQVQQVQAQPLINQYGQQIQPVQQIQVLEEQRNNYLPQYQQVGYHNNIVPNQVTYMQVIDPYQPNPHYFSQPPMQTYHYPTQQYQPIPTQYRQTYAQGYMWR